VSLQPYADVLRAEVCVLIKFAHVQPGDMAKNIGCFLAVSSARYVLETMAFDAPARSTVKIVWLTCRGRVVSMRHGAYDNVEVIRCEQ